MKHLQLTTIAAVVMLLFGGVNEVNADPLTYEVVGDTVTIVSCDKKASGALVVPSTYEGKPVTSIGGSAFYVCTSLTSVTIPDSVTSIGEDAFRGCSNLSSVWIPDSVTNIGNHAFASCSSLTSMTIPDSVTSIGIRAFSGCRGLTSVTIGNSVTSIGNWAFYDCSGLRNITFEGNAPLIGTGAFFGVSEDAKIIVYAGATGFGETFEGLPVIIQKKLEINTFSQSASPFSLTLETKSDSTYKIEASHDLKQWGEIGEVQGTGSSVKFTDWREALFQKQYYRLKLVE